ncbi:hypothetical protein BSPWISOXPB_9229, partial [uncultured Gammaproteobacteria bacterium]
MISQAKWIPRNTLSSYGALELSDKGSIEAVLGVAKATHDISNSADQDNSNGFFASIAYRGIYRLRVLIYR